MTNSDDIYLFKPVSDDDELNNFDGTDRLLIKSAARKGNRKTIEKLSSEDIYNGEYDGHLGYHLMNNILLECLYKATLKQNEFKIFLYVVRQTAGYHRRWCHRNISKISKETGLKRENVYRALRGLKDKNMVFDFLRHDNHKLLILNWRPWKWVGVGDLVQEMVVKIIEKHKSIIDKKDHRKPAYQKPKNNIGEHQIRSNTGDDDEQLLLELKNGSVSKGDSKWHRSETAAVSY